MKTIKIVSQNHIDSIMETMNSIQLENQREDDHTLVVNLLPEQEDIFYICIATYLSVSILEKMSRKYFNESSESDSEFVFTPDEFVMLSQELLHTKYFIGVTYCEIMDYFISNDVINIESFLNFNMIGFESEVKDIINKIVNERKEVQDYEQELGTTIDDLREQLRRNPSLNFDDFSEIHVKEEDGALHFYNRNNEELTKDFVMMKTGLILEFNGDDVLNTLEMQIAQAIFFANLFAPTTIYIHESVSKTTYEYFQDEKRYLEEIGEQTIKVVFLGELKDE